MGDGDHVREDNGTCEERPQKRARLEEANPKSAPTAPIAPIAPAAPVDSDLDREIRAGITEYVSPDNLGFEGVLKRRYTDFLVNEIGLDGRVLHLVSLGVGKRGNGRDKSSVQNGDAAVAHHGYIIKEDDGEAEKKADVVVQEEVSDTAKHEPSAEETRTAESKEEADGPQVSDDDLKALQEIFGEKATTKILSLAKSIRKHPTWKAKDFTAVIAPPIADKEKRTQAHQMLRRIFPTMLESGMEPDQSIRIKACPPAQRGNKKQRGNDRERNPDRHRGGLAWEELGGEYLHFTLYKENKDTMEVIGFLGSVTGGGPKSYGFAGTKDRRACTVQRVSVKRQTAERMAGISKKLFNAAIGDFEYKNHGLGLGDLLGNEFVITLRDCHFEREDELELRDRLQLANETVSRAVKDLCERGFINYFGLQRFGSFSASTDAIGVKLLQGDLKGAIDDILAYSEVALAAAESTEPDPRLLVSQDDKARAKALHLWKTTQNGSEVLKILPKKFAAERNIIQHLSSRNSKSGRYDRKTDWQGALMTVPRNLRLMYVHAYQSLVWNVVAGRRWTTYGNKVVEGDLVLVNEHRDKVEGAAKVEQDTVDQDGEIIINPAGADSALVDEDAFERARPLSKEEAESGKYTIFDVVLPQPGFDVEYPRNAIGEFYKEFMGSVRGGGLDPHDMRRRWRDISLSGGYRKFLARPLQAIEFEVREFVKDDEQLVETDLQRLQRQGAGAKEMEMEKAEGGGDGETAAKEEDGGGEDQVDRKVAVVLKMQLASSQYATMALRELMKAGGVKAYKPEFMGGR
ncbi:pseudouridine synthase-like protein TruD/Pus7 [Westerdykella ornata]|uniref:Pseudouridine synthase-like protein TruD/Pus7 n=1 Tax=Westerdykella ornata TaxID=318751 RepID=A0A6A6J5I3_WESOR|nr:pseudouridine synthase-like protein TruD/Pus7 [Westerdykella ornata]KAF2271850.1 pseudouridine synthase-like protein TruD/Pus7 [Westerdykella ornata]